jgi:hypothetical protein
MMIGLAYYQFRWRPYVGVPVCLGIRTRVVNILYDTSNPLGVNRDSFLKNIELRGPFESVTIVPGGSRKKPLLCPRLSGKKNATFRIGPRLQMTGLSLEPLRRGVTSPFQISLENEASVEFDSLPHYGLATEAAGSMTSGAFSGSFQMAQSGEGSFTNCQCEDKTSMPNQFGYSLEGGTLVEFKSAKRLRLETEGNGSNLFDQPFQVENLSFFELVDGIRRSTILENSTIALDWPDQKQKNIQLLLSVQPVLNSRLSIDAIRIEKGALLVSARGRVRSLIAGQTNDYKDVLPGFTTWIRHDEGWAWFSGILLPLVVALWGRFTGSENVKNDARGKTGETGG